MEKVTQVAQGDILFIRRDELTRRNLMRYADESKAPDKIVAYGEGTGHAHQVFGAARLFFSAGRCSFLQADQDVVVRHVKLKGELEPGETLHPPAPLEKGLWEVRHQRQHDYKAQQAEDVVD